jgi:hypothetical protein
MGSRGQVCIKESHNSNGVWLYTHWGADELILTVQRALKKQWRWGDDEYLARIIFDEMVAGEHGEETGFGIGLSQHADVWRVIEVDCKTQQVTIRDHGETPRYYPFKQFVDISFKLYDDDDDDE